MRGNRSKVYSRRSRNMICDEIGPDFLGFDMGGLPAAGYFFGCVIAPVTQSCAPHLRLGRAVGQLWALFWFKNGPMAWNESLGANQSTPLPPLVSLASNTPANTACARSVVAIQSFFCHSRPCSSRSDLVRQDSEMWIVSRAFHLRRPSDLLCTPQVTGVAVVMSQKH